MTGRDYLASLADAIAPRTIVSIDGSTDGIMIKLSDGKTVDVKRKDVRDAATWDDLPDSAKGQG